VANDKSHTTKRFLYSTGAALIPSAMAWCAGYNFDHRGTAAFAVIGMTLWCFGAVWFCPDWRSRD
jgi:hypothetical protein